MSSEISIVISLLALAITAFNSFMQYLYKKNKIILTISDALIEANQLKILLLYTNLGNQINTITNVSIQLDYKEWIGLENHNHDVACKWIQSFALTEKEQKCLTISYPLPYFNNIDINNVSIRILTCYIDRKGKRYKDHYTCGHLCMSSDKRQAVNIMLLYHKLSGFSAKESNQ